MLPKMARIKQVMSAESIEDVYQVARIEVRKSIQSWVTVGNVLAGKNVGITAGSRGITNIGMILRAIADEVRAWQGEPFIIPAMGSHGGGKAEGRAEVLAGLGITAHSVGAKLKDSDDFTCLGKTKNGVSVYVNKAVEEVDALVIVNRVKQHTDFSGNIESGIHKMCAIGLGEVRGAESTHQYALVNGYETIITEVGAKIMANLPIIGCVGIVENWLGQTAIIESFSVDDALAKERELLKKAKELTIKLPADQIDLLIMDEIGKNISGTGMDTKVVGRIMVLGQPEPEYPQISRIVVLDLTAESHGNATGIGLADFTTKKFVSKVDFDATAINCITSMCAEQGRMPIALDTDRAAIEAALANLGAIDRAKTRVVRIKDTLSLEEIEVSSAILEELKDRSDIRQLTPLQEMIFDSRGRLQPMND